MRRVVMQRGGRRSGSRAEDEAEAAVEADVGDQLHRLREVVVGLAGKADDEVARQADAGPHGAQLAHRALVFHCGVAALHRHQDAVAAVLHRQVQMAHQLRHLGIDVDEPLGELVRVAGGVADSLDAGDVGDVFDQQREVGDLGGVAHLAAIRIDVLPEQGHFLHALVGESGDLDQHVVERARDLFAARVGHDAIAAVLRAAFHDRDERRRAVDAGGRQVIELFDLGKADVDLRAMLLSALVQQLRQAMQRLRAEHHIDIRRALDDRGAFLARDAAADADQHALGFEMLDTPEIAEHLLLRLLAHRAGVEEDQVSLLDIGGRLVALRGMQHVGHLVRVVLVHLAAEGLDEDSFRHGLVHLCAAGSNCHA